MLMLQHTADTASDITAARNEAISYAAYRVLSHRYQYAVDPVGVATIRPSAA